MLSMIKIIYQQFPLFDYSAVEIVAVEIDVVERCLDLECLCARKNHYMNQWHDLLSNKNVKMLYLHE